MNSPVQTLRGNTGHVLYGVPADTVQARKYLREFGLDRIYYGAGVKFRREADGDYIPWHRAHGSRNGEQR